MKIMKSAVRIILFSAIIGILIVAGVALVKRKQAQLENAPKFGLQPLLVTVSEVTTGPLVEKLDYLAIVEPIQTARLAPRITAPVEKVHFDEGTRVQAGTILVELDNREVRHRIDEVAARVEQARAELDGNRETIVALESTLHYFAAEARRFRQLADRDAMPESRAEQAEMQEVEIRGKLNAAKKKSEAIQHRISALRQQKAELDTRLDYFMLKSPFDGVLAARLADPGDLASPLQPLVVVEDRSAVKIAFDVPQTDLPEIREGLAVQFNTGGEARGAEISLMHPSLKESHMLRAEVRLPAAESKSLIPGAYLPISVVLRVEDNLALVPRASLIESPAGKHHVFAVADGILVPRPVEVLGFTDDDRAAVSGVAPGALVVRNTFLGWTNLSAGQKVEAVQ